jgi:hypothetical protein
MALQVGSTGARSSQVTLNAPHGPVSGTVLTAQSSGEDFPGLQSKSLKSLGGWTSLLSQNPGADGGWGWEEEGTVCSRLKRNTGWLEERPAR